MEGMDINHLKISLISEFSRLFIFNNLMPFILLALNDKGDKSHPFPD